MSFTRVPVDALILDMDGVLADTEPLHVEAWTRTLQDIDPVALYEERGRLVGMSSPAIAAELIREFRLSITVEELLRRKRASYRDMLEAGLSPFEGLPEEIARWRHLPIALATSSIRVEVDFMLERIGLDGIFSPIVTSDDVPAAKPAPDCYLLAAERLGRRPSDCLVIEDSVNGMKSALGAGAQVLAVSSTPLAGLPGGVLRVFPSTVEALQWLRS
jgi:HAD superfamily hydrolase (TIGR01509 family)